MTLVSSSTIFRMSDRTTYRNQFRKGVALGLGVHDGEGVVPLAVFFVRSAYF